MVAGTEITIYTVSPGPRLNYVAGFLSASMGINVRITDGEDSRPHILYGETPGKSGFRIPASGFLVESGIKPFDPEISEDNGVMLFPMKGNYDLPFDLFSAIFYLISRYEEYLPFERDPYGRFEVSQSFSFRNGFHGEPLIDQWLILFKTALIKRFPELKFPAQKFRFVPTIDIDSPWAFKNRRPGKNFPGLMKNLVHGEFNDFIRRLRILNNKSDDPYDVYTFIRDTEKKHDIKSLFFILLADNGRMDPNRSLHSSAFRKLFAEISKDHETGIHPSFHSNPDDDQLSEEFSLFKSLTGKSPVISRQHYLIVKFPDTYRRLIRFGIKDDYSMGYASMPAFRASTTLPFKFYDVEKEEESALTIHPFTVMDVTLQRYMQMDPLQAGHCISGLMDKIKAVNGIFVSLWHNESLSGMKPWTGWREVFLEMISKAMH